MSDAVDHGSISAELEGIDLGDKRLNKRCKRLIEALAVDPQLSINASCNGWNETHAAYELLDHSKTTPAKILHPHQAETLRRIQQHPVDLIPQEYDGTRRYRSPAQGRAVPQQAEPVWFLRACRVGGHSQRIGAGSAGNPVV